MIGWLTMIALAQATPVAQAADLPVASPDIVVDAVQRKIIRDFIQAMADPARTEQVPRWENRICSGVIGLDPAQAETLNGRIGELATLGALRLRRRGCAPTVLIVFSTDAGALAEGIAKRYPNTLSGDGRWRLTRFVRAAGPVRWISQTDVVSADGSPLIRVSNSRLTFSTRSVMSSILIIVDAKRLEGVTMGALSDYLAVVALTRPAPGKRPPAQSVLSMFDPDSDGPRAVTDFDRRYIAALYKAPVNVPAGEQKSVMKNIMVKGPAQPAR